MDTLYWTGRKVFLTGHSGFKGSWMCMLLQRLGAEVYGYSNKSNPTDPSLFDLCKGFGVYSTWANINDYKVLERSLAESRADTVIHMAAQAIVKDGFADPYNTFHTNTMGTLNLLQACRDNPMVKRVLVITTDKVYGEGSAIWGFRETDPLKASDPYSTSKACAELVTSCFEKSYLTKKFGKRTATARAGNVVGGGDFNYRLIPMTMEHLMKDEKPPIWDSGARRPWQSVLDCLNGYLTLLEAQDAYFEGSWNFGPPIEECETVGTVIDRICALWSDGIVEWSKALCPVRYNLNTSIRLDTTKANTLLEWKPKWNLETTIVNLVDWYKRYNKGDDVRTICEDTIDKWLKN